MTSYILYGTNKNQIIFQTCDTYDILDKLVWINKLYVTNFIKCPFFNIVKQL